MLGYALLIAGMAGMTWAESVSKFLEPTVRIQTDRGHRVIDTGPYAIVRHPGYVAACVLFIGMPLSLGSFWALVSAACRACSWSCEPSWKTEPCGKSWRGTRSTHSESDTGWFRASGSNETTTEAVLVSA